MEAMFRHWVEAVTAVVVPKDGLTVEDVKGHVKTRLAGFKRLKYIILADTSQKTPAARSSSANSASSTPTSRRPVLERRSGGRCQSRKHHWSR
jgi:hypothetical protein